MVPASAPSDRDAPSPKSTVTSRTGLLPAATVTVNDVGSPTVGGGPVAAIVTVGARFTRTVTVELCPPTDAVTVVSRSVVRLVRASPRESLTTVEAPRVPASAVKETGTPISALPLTSVGLAEIATVPPPAGTVPGLRFCELQTVARHRGTGRTMRTSRTGRLPIFSAWVARVRFMLEVHRDEAKTGKGWSRCAPFADEQ